MNSTRKIIKTADGSSTIYDPITGDHYHSLHGAEQESQHVFIEMGLRHIFESTQADSISLLEIGFGTGLNALLSFNWLSHHPNYKLNYHTLEPFPILETEFQLLEYEALKNTKNKAIFTEMHSAEWDQEVHISNALLLKKIRNKFQEYETNQMYDLIYFDAFAPSHQLEMWQLDIFNKLSNLIKVGGCLVSYCAQGQFRRNLVASGFVVERLQGPPGKREMIRATKV